MKRLSVDDVMSMGPCDDYPRARVVKLWAGREALTAREIGALGIPATDRVWVLARMLSDREARLWACDIAEAALARHWRSDDRRPHEAVRVARLYAVGHATKAELDAARAAARDARDAREAAFAAAWAAGDAWSAAWAATRAAARVVAWAAGDAQVESLIVRIEEAEE